MIKYKDGNNEAVKLVLFQNPSETDPSGKRCFENGFVIDQSPSYLSAGKALWNILRHDPETGGRETAPLFQDRTTGNEVTYGASKSRLIKSIHDAVIDMEGLSSHSLRVGGATPFANSPEGGYFVSGCMDLWRSHAGDVYIHSGKERL